MFCYVDLPILFRGILLFTFMQPLDVFSLLLVSRACVPHNCGPRLAFKLGIRAALYVQRQISSAKLVLPTRLHSLLQQRLEWPGLIEFSQAELDVADSWNTASPSTYIEELPEFWGVDGATHNLNLFLTEMYGHRSFWEVFLERNRCIPADVTCFLQSCCKNIAHYSSRYYTSDSGTEWVDTDAHSLILCFETNFVQFSIFVPERYICPHTGIGC